MTTSSSGLLENSLLEPKVTVEEVWLSCWKDHLDRPLDKWRGWEAQMGLPSSHPFQGTWEVREKSTWKVDPPAAAT